MRWTVAMAEKAMVVAGMLGNTVTSTAWTRFQPGSRPGNPVWKPQGSLKDDPSRSELLILRVENPGRFHPPDVVF